MNTGNKIENDLERFYEHERNTVEYQMVKALFSSRIGSIDKAQKIFTELLKDKFYSLEARRELNTIKAIQSKAKKANENIFTADIGSVIGNLFNKKKSG